MGLNLILQFLFQELKDTQKVRRYVSNQSGLVGDSACLQLCRVECAMC